MLPLLEEGSESTWKNEIILPSVSPKDNGLYWVKIWERNDHKLFYVCYGSGGQISLSPLNSNSLQTISDLPGIISQLLCIKL